MTTTKFLSKTPPMITVPIFSISLSSLVRMRIINSIFFLFREWFVRYLAILASPFQYTPSSVLLPFEGLHFQYTRTCADWTFTTQADTGLSTVTDYDTSMHICFTRLVVACCLSVSTPPPPRPPPNPPFVVCFLVIWHPLICTLWVMQIYRDFQYCYFHHS